MRRLIPVLLAAAAVSCTDGGGPIGLEGTGEVRGVAYVDRNADGQLNQLTDAAASGVNAALLLDATGDTVARATTGPDGTFAMNRVPIGRYRLVATRGALGDSVAVLQIDSATFSLAQDDTARREIRLGYPAMTVAQVRSAAAGRRIVVDGVALNGWSTFGDSTVHLMDASGFIRGVRVLSNVAAGDSIRMLGTVSTRDGQPVLTNVSPLLVRPGVGTGTPDSLSTGTAAQADGGSLDAAHARVAGTIVAMQTLPNSDRVLGVDDGSGRIDVVLDANVNFNTGPYEPGALLRASGVLVPIAAGGWQLKPRSASDVVATYPTVTVAEARALAVGKSVYIEGRALNSWITFADSTVHVADGTGALRVLRVPATTLFAGDSIRMLGTVAIRNAQPVLIAGNAVVLRAGVGLPALDSVSTAVAAQAEGGSRDAEQVAVSGTITMTALNAVGDLVLTIDDTTGALRVVLDRDVGFPTAGYDVGDDVRVRGVLVPVSAGTIWELKPRSLTEVVITG